ncbi:mediator complex subunit, partial [Linderina macrospora]
MSSVQRVPSRVTSDKGNTQVPEAQTQPAMADLGRHGSIPRQPAHSPPPNFSGSDDGSMSEAGSDADLPQVTVDMIPLSVIVGRMVTYAYTELVTLIETLPSRTEENRRSEIQKYTQHMREQLTKLLVLVKWSRNAPQIQKCQNAIAYLQSQNEYFTRAVDGLYATYLALPQARLRNYDVATAADVLTTGTYRRLPGVVKEAFVPPPKLTRAQVSKTLEAINGIIRARILRGEPVPTAMRRYSIDGGKVSFVVAGEFEATLTLLQYSNVPWHVVAIKMLVGSDPALKGEMAIRLDKRQTTDMAQHCQAQLLQESAVPQLARLYDFLHMQSLSILLDTVAKQAAVLRRVRWENLLQIETGADKSLVLRYWTSSRAAAAATTTAASGNSATGGRGNAVVIRLCPLPIPRPIHASAIEGPDALEASPDDADDKHEFLRIEQDRRNLIPKLGLSITWTAQSGLRNTHTWARTVAQASELSEDVADGSDGGVVLDSEGINVERLLRQVTWRHSVKMLESLYSSVVESGLFDEGAVELLYATASGEAKHSVGAAEAAQAAVVPKLRAWYRQGEGAVDITVDAFTGRLVVRASEVVSASASLSEAMIGHLADQANRAPWRLAELLVDMRSSLALADLDSMAFRSLGLRPMGTAGSGLLPGFVLTSVRRRVEASVPAAVASAQTYLMGSPATAAAGVGGSVPAAANFPLRISQQEADALMRGIGTEQPLSRVRFYKIEGCDGEWYLMAAMTDRLHFRLVLLTPHAKDQLLYDVGQVIALQVDRLFSSVARRLLAEKELDPSMLRGNSSHSKRLREAEAEWDVTERVDAMLSGRTSITLDYLNALASTCRARLALRLLQTQLTEWKIPYSFRIPSFSTSPHGHRAAVSKELSVVGLDKQGLYELDEQVPVLYLPIAALMRASPINWHVASSGVLADEARRMVSIRIASDELDPALRSDGMRPVEYRPLGSRTAGVQTLVGRHVIPCQVVASIPVALDGLPATVAAAHADAVYFGAHASPDGGYHGRGAGGSKGGYSKMVLVYRNAGRALQSLIRDWSEHHLMTHVARQLCMWEQRSLRRMLAATTAFYPFSAGPHTSALARMLGAGEHTATELVLQCVDSYLLSISCRVPEPFAPAD